MPLNWLNDTSSRRRADKKDRVKAKASHGEYSTVTNSGAGMNKMDLVGDLDVVETKFTDKTSFRIKAADILKMRKQVKLAPKRKKHRWPIMEITIKDEDNNDIILTVLESKHYAILKEIYRAEIF